MSVSFLTSSDFLQRTTNIIQGNSAYTCTFWFKFNTLPSTSADAALFIQIDDPLSYTHYAGIFCNNTGIAVGVGDGSTFPITTRVPISAGIWYPVAYIRTGTSQQFYIGGNFSSAVTLNLSADVFGFEFLGNDDTGSPSDFEIRSFKEWNVRLFADDLSDEWNSLDAVVSNLANLRAFTPLLSNANDTSGNGNNWTLEGSPTFSSTDNPVFPPNSTAATATAITLLPYNSGPLTINQGGFIPTVWFKYTTTAIDYVLWAFAVADLTNYRTDCRPFLDPNGTFLTNGSFSSPFILPIESFPTPGTVIYFKVQPGTGSNHLIPEPLTFQLKTWMNNKSLAGYIIIPNDEVLNDGYPFPLSIVNPNVQNGITTYINTSVIPVGESMAILPDGTMAFSNEDSFTSPQQNQILIYDKTFTLITTVTVPSGTGHCQALTKAGDGSQFYFVDTANLHLFTLSKTGVIGGTSFATTARNVCIAPDNSIAYYQGSSGTNLNTNRIHRWNLNTNSALSDLTPLGSDNSHVLCRDLLSLADGTLIMMDQAANRIYHISAAGAILHTITPPIVLDASHALDRMCIDPDGVTFWAYLRGNGAPQPAGVLNLVHFQVDGTVLSNESNVVYPGSDGGFDQEAITLTPVEYGPSSSCPFGLMLFDFTPPNAAGTLIIGKASSPEAPLTKDFTVSVSTQADQVLQTDTSGVTLTLPAGTYSVTEAADPTYLPSYFVRNDPTNNDNLNVVVEADGLNEVVIVNELKTKFGGLYHIVPGKLHDNVIDQSGASVEEMINAFFDTFIARDK